MPSVGLEGLSGEGTLTYEEQEGGTILYNVETDDEIMKGEIERYLSTTREFKIPESNDEDDFRVDKAVPTSGLTYFELTLSTLYANTGIKVGW